MYAPTAEIMDAAGQNIGISHVTTGRMVLCLKGRDRWISGKITKMSVSVSPESVTICTLGGRHLTCAGALRVATRRKNGTKEWRRARTLSPGQVIYALDGGILTVDRITCVVQAEKPGEPWITVETQGKNVFAEEILCRA